MATTKDEEPKSEEIVVARAVTKKDIIDAHVRGLNYYQSARKFFGSESDSDVAKVREVVEAEFPEVKNED